ncbi:hypothetical protein GGI15_000482 [Coemansia interrupta]|uniref:Homeobox domain-containing protein n=1 Tax=Coemansia interrupta TaxID=1126814 RepID=A0A9W8HN33_9FUNG|nr:hypothetical protein GGI15_000482 [Coemansia interrupta]
MESHHGTTAAAAAFDQRLAGGHVSASSSSAAYRHYQHHSSHGSMPYHTHRMSAGPQAHSPSSPYYSGESSMHHYHPRSSPPIKGKRKRASPQQLEILNKVFSSTSFPPTDMRNSLARELGMTPRTVQIWFQNKRQASRQRDGNHSRNTKSMCNPGTGILKGSRSLSPASNGEATGCSASATSQSPSPTASYSPSSSNAETRDEQQLMVLVDAATSSATVSDSASLQSQGHLRMATATAGSSRNNAGDNNGYVTATSGVSSYLHNNGLFSKRPQLQDAMGSHPALPPLSSPSMGANSEQRHHQEHRGLGRYATGPQASSILTSDSSASKRHSTGSQFAHTRKDMWFSEETPAPMSYLFGRNQHLQLLSPRARPRNDGDMMSLPKCPPLDASSPSLASSQLPALRQQQKQKQDPAPAGLPVQRSMSLMELLNAAPQDRRLPPLPSTAPLN